jgi:hypothetical protein
MRAYGRLTHYPATLQNYKATRPCKTGLPPDLGVKQAKGLTLLRFIRHACRDPVLQVQHFKLIEVSKAGKHGVYYN